MPSPNDRVAVVTGAARGIGLAIAQRLAASSVRVAILDKRLDESRAAAATLPDGLGSGYECDVTDPAAVLSTVDQLVADFGGCSILVGNHGWTSNKPFAETTDAERRAIVDVNYVGTLTVCGALLPHLVSSGRGRIVFISSDAARIGTPKEAVYAGAKAALVAFGKSLAVELARDGVTVNVVCPGSTDTPLVRTMLSPEQLAKRVRANPMRRLGRPEDVAAAVSYFIGDDAAFVTGQVLSVNGGMTRVD